jgi:hypothetical protein
MKHFSDVLPRKSDKHVAQFNRKKVYYCLRVLRVNHVSEFSLDFFFVTERYFVAEYFEFVGDDSGVVLSTPFGVSRTARHLWS